MQNPIDALKIPPASNFKEVLLAPIPISKPPVSFDFHSNKPLPIGKKPFFIYSQPFSYQGSVSLFTVDHNLLTLESHPFTSEGHAFQASLSFDENLSGKLSFGSLGSKPFVLVPLINGVVFAINLLDIARNQDQKPGFTLFELGIGNPQNHMLFLENLSDLIREKESFWNLVLIASVSNGTIQCFEAGIKVEDLFQGGASIETEEKTGQSLQATHEVRLFYSGIIGKIRNYSDYYLKNSTDEIIATHYFSSLLEIVITKHNILKIVGLMNKSVFFECSLGGFLDLEPDLEPSESPFPKVKTQTLYSHPLLKNDETQAFFMLAMAEINKPSKGVVSLLTFSCSNFRKGPYFQGEFSFSRSKIEEFNGNIELFAVQAVQIPDWDVVITDFTINDEGVLVATRTNQGENGLYFTPFQAKSQGLSTKPVFSRDSELSRALKEDEEIGDYCSKEALVERVVFANRYSAETFTETLENPPKNLNCRKDLADFLLEYPTNKDIIKVSRELSVVEREKLQIKALLAEDSQGFPLVFRRGSISGLSRLDIYSELNEKTELARQALPHPGSISHLLRFSMDLANEYGPLMEEKLRQALPSVFLVKFALRISSDLLRDSFRNENREGKSFLLFLNEHVSEIISQLDHASYRVLRESLVKLSRKGFNHDELLKVFLTELQEKTTKMNSFQYRPMENVFGDLALSFGNLVYNFLAESLKTRVNGIAGFSLDLLVFLRVFAFFNPETSFLGLESLSRITQVFMGLAEVLPRSPGKEAAFPKSLGYFAPNPSGFETDMSKLWVFDASGQIVGANPNVFRLDFPKCAKLIHFLDSQIATLFLSFDGFANLDVDFVPNIMKLCSKSLDSANLLRLYRTMGLKNPSIEFLKAVVLAPRADNSELIAKSIQKSLGYVESFVNLDHLPSSTEDSQEKRLCLLLGVWFDYHTYDETSKGANTVKLLTVFLRNHFSGSRAVRAIIGLQGAGFPDVSQEQKGAFLAEAMNHQLAKGNFEVSTNYFFNSLKNTRNFDLLRLFLSEVEKRPNFQGFFRKLPLGTTLFSDFKAAIIGQSSLSIEMMRNDLQENSEPSSDPLILARYERDPGFIKSLIRVFLAKNSYEEPKEILLGNLLSLLKLGKISKPLSREAYARILSWMLEPLELLLYVFQAEKKGPNVIINPEFAGKADISLIFSRKAKGPAFLLKLGDFQILKKKIEFIRELVTRSENYESQGDFPLEISDEELIKSLVKARMLREAKELAVYCGCDASNLLVYLAEVWMQLHKNHMLGDWTADQVMELIEEIVGNAGEKKGLYLRIVCEKILRGNLQRGKEDEDAPIPVFLTEEFRRVNPNGMVLLYLKYEEFERAGNVVLNYIKETIVKGNALQAMPEEKPWDNIGKMISPNVILAVLNSKANERLKKEAEVLMDTIRV